LYIPPIYFIQIQCHFVEEEEEKLTNFSKNFTKTPKITTKMGITKTPKITSQKVFEDVFDKKMMRGMTTEKLLKEKMEQIKIKNLTMKPKEWTNNPLKIKEKLPNLKTKTTRELIGTTTKNNLVEDGPIWFEFFL